MKVLKLSAILLLGFVFSATSNAQNTNEKKIVVTERITDQNGKVVERKVVKTGEEAERYLREKKQELGIELEKGETTKTINKSVDVEYGAKGVSDQRKMRIKIVDENGEPKLLEWDGEGEMPEEMKKYVEEHNIDMDVDVDDIHNEIDVKVKQYDEIANEPGVKKEVKVKQIGKEGQVVIEKVEGKEIGEEIIIKEVTGKEKKIVIETIEKENVEKENMDEELEMQIEKEIELEEYENDRPRLGVMPQNHVDGVEIQEVITGSIAEKAGLKKGDIIYSINGQSVGSVVQLRDRLSKVSEGAEAKIDFLRAGKKQFIRTNL
ncbi:PDZ domain-containing protein [Portibacter marinus]|uniref:PDZ domain-containing protein n=1 Tax=Portibacter marinus TaxID=2898660 RepID=UPI001F388DE2|nr:PDZ domain-containing protein [Portibacter marinus]